MRESVLENDQLQVPKRALVLTRVPEETTEVSQEASLGTPPEHAAGHCGQTQKFKEWEQGQGAHGGNENRTQQDRTDVGEGSAVKSTHDSQRGPRFRSQHLYNGSQPSITKPQGIWRPPPITLGACMWCTYVYIGKRLVHKRISKSKI